MTERAGWQFELEIHPPEWNFPVGKSWIAGWIFSPGGRPATDLRAWIDDRAFLALHGLPRPGLDERLAGRSGPPYAGFSFLLEPPAGAQLLRIEARDDDGAWHELFRTAIRVAPIAPAAASRPPLAQLLPRAFDDLLRHQAARPLASLPTLADETLAALLAAPLDALPNPPFHGALEEPRDIGWVRYGRISVTGWLAHRERRIVRLTAMVDPRLEVSLLHGLPRQDIGGVFADLPGRETSAFLGHVDLPAGAPRPALLKIFAELDNGEKHLAFAQRFTPRVTAGAEPPLPPFSVQQALHTTWALERAAARARLARGPWPVWWCSVREAWSRFIADAPARAPAATGARPLPTPAADSRVRALVVTHNLNFEGAPWFIHELACALQAAPGFSVTIVSPQDGPLRAVFEQAGFAVRLLDVEAALAAPDRATFEARLAQATGALPWTEIDLVVANTMVSFWAVHAARRAGKPALLYVHESSPVRRFFARGLAPALWPVIEEAFTHATRVVYTAAATQTVHARLAVTGNAVLFPSWVDLPRIDRFAAATDAAALRRKHGLDPAAVLLVNVGSVCERKGQHVFIHAAALLRDELRALYPQANIQFVMVGARAGLYLEMLREEVARLGLAASTVFVPETGDILDFYHVADVFVCTSFEESFPRVLLESAAFRRLIVTTNVNGIAEMLGPEDAWLTPPGDRDRLAEALRAALAAHFAGDRQRAEHARATVCDRYDATVVLPRHVALARAAAAT